MTVSSFTSRVTRRAPGQRSHRILSLGIPLMAWSLSIRILAGSLHLIPTIIVPFTVQMMEESPGHPLFPDAAGCFPGRLQSSDAATGIGRSDPDRAGPRY